SETDSAMLEKLLRTASAKQSDGDSAAALELFTRVLTLLTGPEHALDRAKVLFQTAQLCRYEGREDEALAHYDELLALTERLCDLRGHGLCLAMRGQLVFLRGDKEPGIQAMARGLEELRRANAAEAEHLTCHTRYFSRRMERAAFERCVREATADESLRAALLSPEGC
ncbi:MAG: tetratricopeptide repeat protein, partial [Verrucomicrobia bacterium]|nr:tetratricopeptide repeat protein [Verrucomicrobiota bacterium]